MNRISYIEVVGSRGYFNLLQTLINQSPEVAEAFAEFVVAEFTGLTLSPRRRELLILHTAWHTQSEYAWRSHQVIARSVGVTDVQLASIQQDQIQSFAFNEKEKQLLRFLSRIARSHTLSRSHLEEARIYFSDRELVEIIAVQGFYYTVAILASIFELESDFNRYRTTSKETAPIVH
jgi:alkylhydroperoxidase family enzyme